jgi:hypothetical protein
MENKELISTNMVLRLAVLSKSKLRSVKTELIKIANGIEDSLAVKYTGWAALMKFENDKWTCVCCINPNEDRWQEEELPDYTLMIPIPDPDAVIKFDGF